MWDTFILGLKGPHFFWLSFVQSYKYEYRFAADIIKFVTQPANYFVETFYCTATVCHSVPQCATVPQQCATVVCHSVPQCATVPQCYSSVSQCHSVPHPSAGWWMSYNKDLIGSYSTHYVVRLMLQICSHKNISWLFSVSGQLLKFFWTRVYCGIKEVLANR